VWNQTVKQAVASGIDGIIAVSADPNLYAEAMQSVAAKNVPFVLTEQTPGDKDVKGIDAYIAPDPRVGGADVAEWLKADSGGKAHVLLLDVPGFTNVQQRTAAISAKLHSDCKNCVVYKADITPATLGTSLAPLVTSQLQQHPDINYIWGSDDCCVSFIQQGIHQAGKTDGVKLMSMTGYPQQMTQLKTGEMGFELASPTPYAAWLAVDSLGRLMAGKSTQKFWVLPQRIWTKENIDKAPADVFKKGWDVEFDYESMFHKLWGRGQ
jgi:ABC-type sugar transport system substrate-binding protein